MIRACVAVLLCLFPVVLFAADSLSDVRKTPLPGTVALTFDDGPNPLYTRQILAILKKYDVKATFFMVGMNAEKYPDVVKEIHDQGHVIAHHSLTHPMLTKVSEAQLQKEIVDPVAIIERIAGVKPKCLRYPFNDSNSHVRMAITEHGLLPVPMGFNSFDYKRPGVDKITSWVLKNTYSKQIILMHDGFDKREQTVAALPIIIEGIKKKGLSFSTICA